MKTDVDEPAARTQTPCHITDHGREVLDIGVEEHPDRHGDRLILHRQDTSIRADGGRESPACEPELVRGDVEPDRAVARVRDDWSVQPGTAGHVQAYPAGTSAQAVAQVLGLLGDGVSRKGLVVPVSMAVIPGIHRLHGDRLPGGLPDGSG
jgi:hypothetical protein